MSCHTNNDHKGIIGCSIATRPHQFVGYWGYDSPAESALAISDILCQNAESNWHQQSLAATGDARATLHAGGLSERSHARAVGSSTQLALGRDLFGRVPLYWTQVRQTIWFASHLQLLLPLADSAEVDLAAFYGYSCFSYVPTPLTPVTGIFAVPAGTEIVWQSDPSGTLAQPQTHRPLEWREATDRIDDEKEAIAQLQRLLEAAIARRITDLPDEPVGVFLSGGIDSSIVAAALVRAGVKTRAYTLDFGDRGIPEFPYAERVARWLEIPIVKVRATPRRIQQSLPAAIEALDLPFGDGVTVPLFLLNQAASQETRVVFNGEGGDQLFAGWTNKPLIAASIYQTERPQGVEPFDRQYLQTFHRLWGYEDLAFQPAVRDRLRQLQPETWLQSALDPAFATSLLHRLRRATLSLKGAQNIHPRATNLAAASGLHVRSPFCDLPLALWAFRLSGELCLQGSCEKYILKRAVETWLPPEIVWRRKRGMGVPLTSWFANEWWRSLGTWLNPAVLQAEGRWQPNLAAQLVSGEFGGRIQGRRIGEILWLLVVWQVWRSRVLREPSAKAVKLSWNHPFWLPHQLWRHREKWL